MCENWHDDTGSKIDKKTTFLLIRHFDDDIINPDDNDATNRADHGDRLHLHTCVPRQSPHLQKIAFVQTP